MRNIAFDIAKFIAILLVVIAHLLTGYGIEIPGIIVYTHMPVFFFISGYFLQKSNERYSTKKLMIKKITGLLIPYITWSAIACMTKIIPMLATETEIEKYLITVFNTFVLADSVWFFLVLFYSTILVIACVNNSKRHGVKLTIVIWMIVTLLPIGQILAIFRFKMLFPFLIAGYAIAERHFEPNAQKNTITKIIQISFTAAALLICLLILRLLYVPKYYDVWQQFNLTQITNVPIVIGSYAISFGAVAIVLSISDIFTQTRIAESILPKIGQSTSDIYVLHMPVVRLVVKLVNALYISPALIIVESVVITGACYYFQRELNRYACYRWLFGRKKSLIKASSNIESAKQT